MSIFFSPAALADLKAIKEYITLDLENPQAASNTVNKITDHIKKLEQFPESGAPLSSIVAIETSYRFIICENYIAFYKVSENNVYISRIIYKRRDYIKILFENQ